MNLIEIKESLEPENIKQILSEYGVLPIREETEYFIYPTICHNLDGGSGKMYYYFNTKLFVCYTECDENFNIFELIQKMEALQGYKISIFSAAEKIGLGATPYKRKTELELLEDRNRRFIENSLSRTLAHPLEYEVLDSSILRGLKYNSEYLKPWLDEGMTEDVLKQFDIGYSLKDIAISIPHKDKDGNLIGVRGRFMEKDALNKYMPLSINGKLLNHSIRGNLYGYYENIGNIRTKRRAVLYEGEKSVLLHGSYYGIENNIALAVAGNKISNEQINLLINNNIQEVVIAFDQDFTTPYERDMIVERYMEIGERLSKYFKVSVLIDWEDDLDYKDSPIDKGVEVFNKLYKNRFFVGGL